MLGPNRKPARDLPPIAGNLRLLRAMVKRGELMGDDIDKAVALCSKYLEEGVDASPRDRIAAAKTLASLYEMSGRIALELHKHDRLDEGKATENVSVKLYDVKAPVSDV